MRIHNAYSDVYSEDFLATFCMENLEERHLYQCTEDTVMLDCNCIVCFFMSSSKYILAFVSLVLTMIKKVCVLCVNVF